MNVYNVFFPVLICSFFTEWGIEFHLSRGSSVGIAKGYRLDGRGSIIGRGKTFFLYSTASIPALEPTQPLNQWVPAGSFLGVKWPGNEANRSPPRSRMVQLHFHSPIRLHGLVLNWYTKCFFLTSDRSCFKFLAFQCSERRRPFKWRADLTSILRLMKYIDLSIFKPYTCHKLKSVIQQPWNKSLKWARRKKFGALT
jgi:hypothetical protein